MPLFFQKIDPDSTDWQEPVPPDQCPVDAVMKDQPEIIGCCGVWESLFSGWLAMRSGLTAYDSAAAVSTAQRAADFDPGPGSEGWTEAFLSALKGRVAAIRSSGIPPLG